MTRNAPTQIIGAVLGAALFSCLSAMPAHAELVQQSESGFVVRHTVEVARTPMEAWETLIAPSRWWAKEHSWSGDPANFYLDAQASGCFCEQLPPPKGAPEGTRGGSVEHMRVIYSEPGRVLRMSGALGPLQGEAVHGTLTVTLKPVDGGTRILFEYVVGGYMRFPVAEIAPQVDKVISMQLGRLAMAAGPLVRGAADKPVARDGAGSGTGGAASPKPEASAPKPASKPDVTPTPKPASTPAPKPVATPSPKPAATPAAKPAATPAPKPAATPTPKPKSVLPPPAPPKADGT